MDGGGRFLRSLTAGIPGGARPASPDLPTRSPRLLRSASARRRFAASRGRGPLPRGLGTLLTFGFFGAVAVAGLVGGGHLDEFQARHGEPHHALARAVGLGVETVTLSGIAQMTEAEVLAAAGVGPKTSLAFLSVAETRERLERVPLIKSASVRKLFPNELAVTLVEREPHAVWQLHGELFVVAADGTVIDGMRNGRFADLPFVVGEGANGRVKEYLALLEAAGPLRSRIRAGTLVSGRRWTLKMTNGLDVRLPEQGVAEALQRLAMLQAEQRILDKDVLALDLRVPDRVAVRLSEEAAEARAEAVKKKPARGKGVDT
jgi:cell division protein FtsQ